MARRARTTAVQAPARHAPLPPLGEPLAGPGEPLRIDARLHGAVAMPWGPIALDGLLAWAVCARADLLAPVDGLREVEIPVAREPGGRFHLCSFSLSEVEERENKWINRRFPVPEAQMMGDERLKRIQISAGPCKSYRLPLEVVHLRGDMLTWYAKGDRARIEELLELVAYVGKKRSTGNGRVARWTVEPCAAWQGFPLLRDGVPLRALPADWTGVTGGDRRICRLSYPYWLSSGQEACAVP